MNTQQAKRFAPMVNDEQRLDVTIKGEKTVVKLSVWVDGLGWSCQKTMELEPALVEDLHRALAAARVRTTRETILDGQSKVIPFPTVD